MNGKFTHEHILDLLEERLTRNNVAVLRQAATRRGRETGYADLLAVGVGWRLVVEAEMSSRRVANDLRKAADLDAWLWIVAPNTQVSAAIGRRLRKLGVRPKAPWICVLTLGQALRQVENCFPLFSLPLVQEKQTSEDRQLSSA